MKEFICEEHKKPMLGGSMITNWKCKNCGKGSTNGSTAIPSYCQECATNMNICIYCGIELKTNQIIN